MEKQINGKTYLFEPDDKNGEIMDACKGCAFEKLICYDKPETEDCMNVGGIWKLKE